MHNLFLLDALEPLLEWMRENKLKALGGILGIMLFFFLVFVGLSALIYYGIW